MKYGYVRVSSAEKQNWDLQVEAINRQGVDKIFSDKITGVRDDRKGLQELLTTVKPGDEVVVWKLDRIGRSVIHLLKTLEDFDRRGIVFRSLTESFATNTPLGRFTLVILSGVAQLERDVLIQRTNAGIASARLRGVRFGRPSRVTPEQFALAQRLIANNEGSVSSILRSLKIPRSSYYDYVKSEGSSSR